MFGIKHDPRWTRVMIAFGALVAFALAAGVDYKW
jgi:hypothetical protein